MAFSINEVKVVVGQDSTERYSQVVKLQIDSPEYVIDNIVKLRKKEIDGLISFLEKEGITTDNSRKWVWPRDDYIFHNNLFFSAYKCGNWAIGGAHLFTKDYVLVPEIFPNFVNRTKEEVTKIFCDSFNVKRCHFMPIMNDKHHLDLYLLILPDLGVLVSDSEYYRTNKQIIDEVAKKEDLDTIVVPNPDASISPLLKTKSYPTNSLDIMQESGKLLVYTAKPDVESPLVSALKNYDVQVIEVPFRRILLSGGSIRCKTNFTPRSYNFNAN